MEVMQEVVQTWLDSLDTEGEIELTGEIGRLVQEVAGNCFLGPEIHQTIGREFWDLYTDIGKALDPLLPPNLPLPKFRRRDRAKRQMIEILRPVIIERRQHPERYDDFLQDLVNKKDEHGQEAGEELILNMLIAFMFAGHETTAGQAAWTIIMLLQHPDMLRRVLDEIEQAGVMTGAIDHRQLAQLQKLAWTVREVERLRPSAELLLRTVKEDIEFEGYLVPAGWLVQVSQGISHRLPDHFEQPDQFDPLRYAPERAEDKQHRFALFGFGGGIHKCTGMNFANTEMIIITTLLLRKFELALLTPEPGIERGLGASRPEKTMVKYRRLDQSIHGKDDGKRRLVQSFEIGPIYSTPSKSG
jgi:sterol 14-demethylase